MITNSYPESVEESKSILRMTLQNISKHGLPYTPITYLIWYEYSVGKNQELINNIDLLLEEKNSITMDSITELFKNHIVDNQVLIAEEKAKKFQKILVEMSQHLGESSNEIDSKGGELETFVNELSQASSMDTIAGITERIISETKSMVVSSKTLKGYLDSTVSKISKLNQELKKMKQAATTDMLTRLLNRRGFDEALGKILDVSEVNNKPLSVVMLDIDHFKKVNDTHGHMVGDNVLRALGKLLKDSIKGKDLAARFGGEEFILALPQTPTDGAYTLSEQIRSSLEKMKWKIKDTGKSIGQISISLGIALYRDGEPVDDAIKRADDALYRAKSTGRNRTVTEFDLEKT